MLLTTVHKQVENGVVQVGLDRVSAAISKIAREGESIVNCAGQAGKCCAKYYSGIHAETVPATKNSTIVSIDIGGSNTKVGVRRVDASGKIHWTNLFEAKNEEFNQGTLSQPLERFATTLMGRIAACVSTSEIDGVSIVWSNALAIKPIPVASGIKGVTGTVIGKETAYRKGEFFVKGLKNGDDVGEILLKYAKEAGFAPKAFIIGNDTIFAMKSLPGASAAVIASTGANATLVEDGMIYNTELGATFVIAPEYLSDAEKVIPRAGAQGLPIEELIAGKWLERNFVLNCVKLAVSGIKPFEQPALVAADRELVFPTNEQISQLARGDYAGFIQAAPAGVTFNQAELSALRMLSLKLEERSAELAGAMLYLSVCNQITSEPKEFCVALDSRMARSFPNYLKVLEDTSNKLAGGSSIIVELLAPEGQISVPMRGAANALDNYLNNP